MCCDGSADSMPAADRSDSSVQPLQWGMTTDDAMTTKRRSCWEITKHNLLLFFGLADACARLQFSCADTAGSTTSYERLASVSTFVELNSLCSRDSEEKDTSNEKEEELVFYNDDGSSQNVVVERNLCAADLCQLLALKNRVASNVNWIIVEHWTEFGLERCLEDHEDVLSAHHDMENYGKLTDKRFIFRKDFRKYEFFHNPKQFFPADMVDLDSCQDTRNHVQTEVLQTILSNSGECPLIFSEVYVREPTKIWNKAYLVLKDKKLYLSYKIEPVAKHLRKWKSERDGTSSGGDSSPIGSHASKNGDGELRVYAHLSDYHVYTTLNARKQFQAPTEFGLCLRPTSSAVDEDTTELLCLACESERARLCWLTAMRLAKYGKQLRENYRAFKNKQGDAMGPKEYNSYTVPHESVRSRVAMDFTGSVGRIVEDPKEANAIAVSEGYMHKRRWRPSTRGNARTPSAPLAHVQGIESGFHMGQPWFHSGMSRDQATQLIMRHGTVNGVFLVRESRSTPGAFVLTFKCNHKVYHLQIQPVLDRTRDSVCYSLDAGITRFYDLLQLVEFYQLNAGCLATRLTHYVVQSPTGPLFKEKGTAMANIPVTNNF